MRDETVIAIVGGGASGLAVTYKLIAEILKQDQKPNLTIYFIDRKRHFGRGLAYDGDISTNLLNTRAAFISPIAGDPGHFLRWLTENEREWRDDFPGLKVTPDAFLPRPLFGLYLEHLFAEVTKTALRLGSRVIAVNAEVTDIEIIGENDLVVQTDQALAIRSDYVVLCCGNLPSTEFRDLADRPNFFVSPYPIRSLSRAVPKGARVGVAGTRLGAIDTIVGLAGNDPDATFHAFSRSGRLPSVRGTQGRYVPRLLNHEHLASLVAQKGRLRLQDMLDLILAEIEIAQDGAPFDPAPFFGPPPAPLEFLDREIASSDGKPRMWQAVLYATNAIMDYAWAHLDEGDKALFLRDHFSTWVAYRVSIPIENAMRLRDLILRDRLHIHPGASRIIPDADGSGFRVTMHRSGGMREEVPVDAVVCATGTPRDVHALDSRLTRNLLAKGIAQADRFGGILVDHETGQVRGIAGQSSAHLIAIGELTSGAYFFTSVLEVIARHAAERAATIIRRITTQPETVPRTLRRAAAQN